MALTVPSGNAHQSRSRTQSPRSRRSEPVPRRRQYHQTRTPYGEELAREPEARASSAPASSTSSPLIAYPTVASDEAADLAADEDDDEVPDLEDLRRASTGRAAAPLRQRRCRAAAVPSAGRVPAGTESDSGRSCGTAIDPLGSRTGDRAALPWSIRPQWEHA